MDNKKAQNKNVKIIGIFVLAFLSILTIYAVEFDSDLRANLISYYEMEDDSGVISDSYGANNGTYNGSLYSQDGIINDSIGFDGSNDAIDLGDSLIPTNSDFTVNLWFNTSSATIQTPISQYDVGQDGRFSIHLYHTAFGNSLVGIGGFSNNLQGANLTDGDWHMMTVTREGNVFILYEDGLQVDNFTEAGSLYTGRNTWIGRNSETDGQVNGNIDEVGFWGRALTPTEVNESLYNNGNSLAYVNGSGATDNSPSVTLNLPADSSVLNNTITFNCLASDDINLTNISLYIDGVLNETNSSGLSGVNYTFDKDLALGSHNWTCEAYDNASQSTTPTVRTFSMWEENYSVTNTSWNFVNTDGLRIYCNIYNNDNSDSPLWITATTWSDSAVRTAYDTEAQYYRDLGYFSATCETRGKGDSEGTIDATGYEQRDIYEIAENLIAQYPNHINSSQKFFYGESGAGGIGFSLGVNYPDYFNAISPVSGMVNYTSWTQTNPAYHPTVSTRINSTGAIDEEGNNSRNVIRAINNIYSFFSPSAFTGDTAVNVSQSRDFNTSMSSVSKGNLVHYLEIVGAGHAGTSATRNHTEFWFNLKTEPVIVPLNSTLYINGYIKSKRLDVEFLSDRNKVGDIVYDLTNQSNIGLNLSTDTYKNNVSITIYNITKDDFFVYRNTELIINVTSNTTGSNDYQATYSNGENLTFISPNITASIDEYLITIDEIELCVSNYTNESWSAWADTEVCQPDSFLTQSRSLNSYDENGCSSNITHTEYQEVACTYSTGGGGGGSSETIIVNSSVEVVETNITVENGTITTLYDIEVSNNEWFLNLENEILATVTDSNGSYVEVDEVEFDIVEDIEFTREIKRYNTGKYKATFILLEEVDKVNVEVTVTQGLKTKKIIKEILVSEPSKIDTGLRKITNKLKDLMIWIIENQVIAIGILFAVLMIIAIYYIIPKK